MRRVLTVFALAVLALDLSMGRAHASPPPDQIEEDWQVVIGTPDPVGAGPQISTYMSPVADGSTPFFVFDMNYCDNPSFSPGGLQVQAWSGDNLLRSAAKGTAQCSTANETITWTQRMTVSSGTISFAINSGESTTWKKFGQGKQLDLGTSSFTTSLTSLSTYSPATSVANSGVGWEANRVTSMKLLEVRYYAGGMIIKELTDKTQRPVNLSN
jgi:hypothetical protein